jgi:hypothetical protein
MDLPEHVSKIHPERDAEASAVEEGVLDSAQMSSRIGSDSARFQPMPTSIGRLACSEPKGPASRSRIGCRLWPSDPEAKFHCSFHCPQHVPPKTEQIRQLILAKTSIQNASLGPRLIFSPWHSGRHPSTLFEYAWNGSVHLFSPAPTGSVKGYHQEWKTRKQ